MSEPLSARTVEASEVDDRIVRTARLLQACPEMLALLQESQRNLTGDWRERRDALLERLSGDEK